MAERIVGAEIERLIQLLARLPGLGPRSARRAALHLIRRREDLLGPLADAMAVARSAIRTCSVCGNVDTVDPCGICRDPRRDPTLLVVVESVADLWALERAETIRARYHVLGGTLSPLDGIGPDDLNLATLAGRIVENGVTEVILAVNAHRRRTDHRPLRYGPDRPSRRPDDAPRAWRAGRWGIGLSRRRDAVGRAAEPNGVLKTWTRFEDLDAF